MNEEWGQQLIKGWNVSHWMQQPGRVGNIVAKLIGAASDSVMMGDTLSIKVFQALASALALRPDRRIILSDNGNFPTDLYIAEGLINTINKNHELRLVDPDVILNSIDESIAVVMLTQIDYRSGRMHDMDLITKRAQAVGAVVIWDLAHSAGALPVDLARSNCEFAVGCTYKYLNGGPGAPAFIYVRPDLMNEVQPALAGWMGHDSPFAFELGYRPAKASIERMRVGTPPVIQMSALEAALSVWESVDMTDLRAASIALTELFIAEVEQRCPALTLASPRDPNGRGSQVSFAFKHGYAVMQALIDHNVIGDFRSPDLIRFGFTPLYIDEEDVIAAVKILQHILDNDVWKKTKYQVTHAVT